MAEWPALPSDEWFDTLETVHLWTQVVGKVRMVCSPWINHSWSVTLYVSPSGLRTSLVPYGTEAFEWSFDFVEHHLELVTSRGERRRLELGPMTVADFHAAVIDSMASVAMPVSIDPMPNEMSDAVPFPDDTVHASYRPEHIHAWWRAALQTERVFTRFRAGYWGTAGYGYNYAIPTGTTTTYTVSNNATINQLVAQTKEQEHQYRLNTWKNIDQATQDVRRAMVKKDQVEF